MTDSSVLDADQPRNRLIASGVHTLTNTDLVALLLSDDEGEEAGNLTRELLSRFRSLQIIARCNPREIAAVVDGLTKERAVQLTAAFELGRRVAQETTVELRVDSPDVVCELLAQDMRTLTRESLRAILLDTKFQLLHIEEIALGSLTESIAHPREIFRPAITHSAYAMILVHNHPSGDPTPSPTDEALTRRLVEASKILDIVLADHIIIGGVRAGKPSYYSFKEAEAIS